MVEAALEAVDQVKWPVSRSRYDLAVAQTAYWQEKYTALVDTMMAMKQAGFVKYDGPKKPVLTGEFKQSDEQVVAEAERRFVDKLKEDFVRQGISVTDAAKEAARIRREVVTP